MAKAKAAPKLVEAQLQAAPSKMKPGKASRRVRSRFIVLYGAPKCRKTSSASTLNPARTKWIISDSNTIATLVALNRLPPDENIYEVTSVPQGREVIEEAIGICESADGPEALGVDTFVVDSGTAFSDWHQQDIARMTGQRFMGDNSKNNGWQQFNAEFGQFLDSLATLSKHVNVVLICHAKEKADLSKGEWAGLNLSPQMSLRAARGANWVLYQTCRDLVVDENQKEDAFIQNVVVERDGTRKGKEVVINTMTAGVWIASVNARKLKAEEPGDLQALLEKEGLL